MDIFQEDLKELREQITAIDNDVVALLGKRKSLTDKIIEFKHEQQASAFVAHNEETVLKWRKEVAMKYNMNEALITDIFRLVMYDAYHSSGINYQKVAKAVQINNVVIVGDNNPYAVFFQQLFRKSGYITQNVNTLNNQESSFLTATDVLLVTEPLPGVLSDLGEKFEVNPELLVIDLSVINMTSIDYLMTNHAGPSLGLHPMFSPSVKGLNKEVIILCHGNLPTKYIWFIDQLKVWGVKIIQASPHEHDNLMLIMSSLNQFFVFSHAKNLVEQGVDLETLLNSSGPSYRLSLMMLGRYFSKAKPLKAKRLFNNEAITLIKQCVKQMNTLLTVLENNDQAEFTLQYNEICQWFGHYADAFDLESNRISRLQQLNPLDEMVSDDEIFFDDDE